IVLPMPLPVSLANYQLPLAPSTFERLWLCIPVTRAFRLNGLNTGSRFQTGSQTSLPAKNDLLTFNFKQRHARLLRALQIGSQHCYPKFAFVQALRPECELFIARLAATLFLSHHGITRRIPRARQPDILPCIPLEIQQRVSLARHSAAEIADWPGRLPRVPLCALRQCKIAS